MVLMEAVVGFILIAAVIAFMVWGKIQVVPIIILLPFIAALICGYSPAQIGGFIIAGQGSVSDVVLLFAFAILYFNALNDVGVFDIIINKILKRMGNHTWMVFLITALVAAVAHLDGSGATTVAITIPLMFPIYKKMKLNPAALILFLALGSGVINLLPWSAPAMGLSAAVGSNPQGVWQSMIGVQVVWAIIIVLFCFFLGKLESKKGAGLSQTEFDKLRDELSHPAELKISSKLLVFDLIFTVFLILALLFAWLPTAACFMIGFSVILITNFKGAKEQMGVIQRHGGMALSMVIMMMGVGAFVGILSNTQMLPSMVQVILNVLPESLGPHLVFIIALITPLLCMAIGLSTVSSALGPILVGVVAAYGATANEFAASLMIGESLAANFCFLVPSTYLALGLAGIDMGQNLKYSFKWIILFNTILVIIAALFGAFSF